MIKIEKLGSLLLLILLVIQFNCYGQIIAGPIQGVVKDNEVSFWVLVDKEVNYNIHVTEKQTGRTHYIEKMKIDELYCFKKSCSINFLIYNLKNDTQYLLQIVDNETAKILNELSFSTPDIKKSEADDFSIITGSCAYASTAFTKLIPPYRGIKIYKAMSNEKAEFMVWQGDNIYYVNDETATKKLRRNMLYRKKKKLNKFLKSMPQIAIWDDHDYGPNDAKGDYIHKEISTKIFQNFWVNPKVVDDNYFSYQYQDVEFFMLDNRSNSTQPNISNSTILGAPQKKWLYSQLKKSKAIFKIIVCGQQFISSHAHDNAFSLYPKEREEILSFIRSNKIEGVLFLSGDRHFSEVSKAQLPGLYSLYDFTCSPITSWTNLKFTAKRENKTYRLPGSLFIKRCYAKLNFMGTANSRRLIYELYNQKGKRIYTYILKANDLKF